MPARRNNNHDLGSTVKRFVGKVNNGATTPHGMKTVEPDEGLNLMSSSGSHIPWNYETARAWKSAIDYGTDQVERAKLQLETTQIELDLATERIGQVAAGEIEKIDGHIIVNGTVDLPALNVTDAMSAAIVNAMSTNTRKLVVTEDAILNRATVVQGLVTSELITERANVNTLAANMISARAMTVFAADGSGIAMVPEGFLAFDATRMATVLINGKNNVITGDLQTGAKGSRARISTRKGTSAIDFLSTTQAHGGVWYDESDNRMTIAAMPDGGYDPATSASMSFHSDTRAVRFNAAVDISHGQQHGYVQFNSPGLTAGQSSDFTIKFRGSLAAGAKPFAYFTPEASSGASLVCTLKRITETEMSVTLRNLSSFNSGLIYLWWTVIARTKWW